jgi:hypothetical protein
MDSAASVSSSGSSPRARAPAQGSLSGRAVNYSDPDENPIGLLPQGTSSTDGSPNLQRRVSTEKVGIVRRISNSVASIFKRESSENSSSTSQINRSESNANLSLRDKFRLNTNPKLLLVPEAHNSKVSRAAREFIRDKSAIRSFSEGQEGQQALRGIRALETSAVIEIAPTLNQYLSEKDLSPNDLPPGAISTEEDVYTALREHKTPEKTIKKVKAKFFKAKSPEEQQKAITYFQNHFRDKKFAKAIKQECEELKNDPAKIAVGFFGATHLIPGYDEDANRSTDKRIPQRLKGEPGDDCIRVNGVDVYIYPHVLDGDEDLSEFSSYFD